MESVISPVNIEERANFGIRSGDTVRVWQKIREKDKTRLQAFEGLVLAVKHGKEAGASFTVRRTTGGFAVEKIFPLYSPMIDKIEIIKRAKVRRSKLYHIREKAAREIRRQMRNMKLVNLSTESDKNRKAEGVSEEPLVATRDDSAESAESTGDSAKKEKETKEDAPTEEKKEEIKDAVVENSKEEHSKKTE